MAGLEGFDVSLNTGDLVVAEGTYNGAVVAGATLDASGLADGVAYAVTNGGALALVEVIPEGSVAVASCTVATDAATLETLAFRGADASATQ